MVVVKYNKNKKLVKNIFNRPEYLGIFKQIQKVAFFFIPLNAHSCQWPSAEMPTKLPCHQAEWHQRQQPGGRRWQQHTALTGMSTEMQLRPLTASSFWRTGLRGKSFNRPDSKYFRNLLLEVKGVLMFKEHQN